MGLQLVAGTAPFTRPSSTDRDNTVTGICFRAIPSPQVTSPLLQVAGEDICSILSSSSKCCTSSKSCLIILEIRTASRCGTWLILYPHHPGPVPFVIRGQNPLAPRCLRAPGPPYTTGQAPEFSFDCSGAAALWTFNANTQQASQICSSVSP